MVNGTPPVEQSGIYSGRINRTLLNSTIPGIFLDGEILLGSSHSFHFFDARSIHRILCSVIDATKNAFNLLQSNSSFHQSPWNTCSPPELHSILGIGETKNLDGIVKIMFCHGFRIRGASMWYLNEFFSPSARTRNSARYMPRLAGIFFILCRRSVWNVCL